MINLSSLLNLLMGADHILRKIRIINKMIPWTFPIQVLSRSHDQDLPYVPGPEQKEEYIENHL